MTRGFLVGAIAMLAIGSVGWGQDGAPPPGGVDKNEVERMGDRIAVAGEGGPRGAQYGGQAQYPSNFGIRNFVGNAGPTFGYPGFDDLYAAAIAVPEDDSDQWHIAMWGTSTDPLAQKWLAAFQNDPHLTPFVAKANTPAGKKAWAHWMFFHADDGTQTWRFRNYKINPSEMPFLTINPPRNGQFGNTLIVVDGIDLAKENPTSVEKRIQRTIKEWCAFLSDGRYARWMASQGGGGGQWNSLPTSYWTQGQQTWNRGPQATDAWPTVPSSIRNPYPVQDDSNWTQATWQQCKPGDNCFPNKIPKQENFEAKHFPDGGPGNHQSFLGGKWENFLQNNAVAIAAVLAFLIFYLRKHPEVLGSLVKRPVAQQVAQTAAPLAPDAASARLDGIERRLEELIAKLGPPA